MSEKKFNPDATQPVSAEDRAKLEEMLKNAQAAKENAAATEGGIEDLLSEWEKKGVIDPKTGHAIEKPIGDDEIDKAFEGAKVAPALGSESITDADLNNTIFGDGNKEKPVQDEVVDKMFGK